MKNRQDFMINFKYKLPHKPKNLPPAHRLFCLFISVLYSLPSLFSLGEEGYSLWLIFFLLDCVRVFLSSQVQLI
jgi:hypothetical protein